MLDFGARSVVGMIASVSIRMDYGSSGVLQCTELLVCHFYL